MLFANVRPEGFRGSGVLIGDILEGTTSYVPLLTYGDSATYGDQIRFGTGTDVFGEDPLSGAESEPTAQWLEVTVSSPDAPPVTTRREVFDRVGAAVRAAGTGDPAALGLAELTPSGEGDRQDYLPALTVHWLTVSTGTLGGEELRAALAPTEEPGATASRPPCTTSSGTSRDSRGRCPRASMPWSTPRTWWGWWRGPSWTPMARPAWRSGWTSSIGASRRCPSRACQRPPRQPSWPASRARSPSVSCPVTPPMTRATGPRHR